VALGQQIAADISKTQVRLQTEAVASGKQVGSFLYFAIAMACMFLLLSGSLCLSSIASEERRQTLARMMASPTAKVQLLLGKALGQVCITILQFTILYLVTSLVFKADWGNPLAVFLLALAYTFAIAGLAMVVAALVPNRGAAVGAWSICVQIMAALGGSMVPLSQFPAIMLKVAQFNPNYWGLRGFLDIALDLPLPLVNISALAAIGFLGIALGTWRLARS
jgi:ABC-2 type transport system permease protein